MNKIVIVISLLLLVSLGSSAQKWKRMRHTVESSIQTTHSADVAWGCRITRRVNIRAGLICERVEEAIGLSAGFSAEIALIRETDLARFSFSSIRFSKKASLFVGVKGTVGINLFNTLSIPQDKKGVFLKGRYSYNAKLGVTITVGNDYISETHELKTNYSVGVSYKLYKPPSRSKF